MKNLIYLYLLPFVFSILACSGEKEKTDTTTSLSEKSFEFEIYDSLVVDYLGNLILMDISPDETKFLLYDQNTAEILVTDRDGGILYNYIRNGDGPEDYGEDKSGNAVFITNEEFLIPTTSQVVQFNLEGDFIRKFKPDFNEYTVMINPSSNSLYQQGDFLYYKFSGRYAELEQQGIEYQTKSTQLEKVNIRTGVFEPIISFPKTSKYSSSEFEFGSLDFQASFTVTEDSLHVLFRNEPKLFGYALTNLNSPAYSKVIPLPFFVERDTGKELNNGGFNTRDYLLGSMNSIYKIDNSDFLINYNSGLTDEQFEEVNSATGGNFNDIFSKAAKFRVVETVVFNGSSVSKGIKQPELLGNIAKVVSKDEIWFNLDFSKVENDYSVIYKTRIVSK